MMPSRATIEAATPKCPEVLAPAGITRLAQPCGRPLLWRHDHASWVCPKHGQVLSGETAAARWSEVPAAA